MSLDEVLQNNNNSMFDVEMDYEQVMEIPDDYLQVRLNEMEHGDTFEGKPQISDIIKATYDDGFDENGNEKTKTVYKLRLILVNDDEEQYLDININLKENNLTVPVIRKGSVLFDCVQSILELENKGCTNGKNIFRNVNLKQFIDFINNLQTMKIRNIERHGGNFNYNSFYIVKLNNLE